MCRVHVRPLTLRCVPTWVSRLCNSKHAFSCCIIKAKFLHDSRKKINYYCVVKTVYSAVRITELRELCHPLELCTQLAWTAGVHSSCCTCKLKLIREYRPNSNLFSFVNTPLGVASLPSLTHLTMLVEKGLDMQPCSISRLCNMNLVVFDTPLPLNLTCMSQLTQLRLQMAADNKDTHYDYVGCIDVNIEWYKLNALQSVSVSGWTKLVIVQ